jgi:hypothetical protein
MQCRSAVLINGHNKNQSPGSKALEVLLAPDEAETLVTFAVHVAQDVELRAQAFGSAEEDARFSRRVELAYRPEDHVPVGPAKVGRSSEACDGVAVTAVEHDVVGI